MAGKNEIKASVRLDGGAQFKKDITDVNKNLKQLDAESKKVAAEFDGQANSLQALTAKQKVLNDTLEQAERKVQLYDSRIKSLESQQKAISEATDQYRKELKDAQDALAKMDNHVRVSSTIYLQELLSQIIGNSIHLSGSLSSDVYS